MHSFTTPERHGYSVRFSPFGSDRLLLATSQLFGLAGGGTLYLLEQNDEKGLQMLRNWEWSDGIFDVAWCPSNEHVAATASGDGTLQIWSLAPQQEQQEEAACSSAKAEPVMCLNEHKNEVYSIDWGAQWNYNQLLSSSWDGSIKLWDCNRKESVSSFLGHTDLIYCSRFSSLIANLFASVGTDGNLNLWNSFDFTGKPLMSVHVPNVELLSCDWSQFDRNLIITGASDGLIRAWDLRNMRQHIFTLYSGDFAVRRLACSPMSANLLASANYDFTTRIWDLSTSVEALSVNTSHTEFVCGLDWNTNAQRPHQLADCGWDAVLNVFTPQMLKN